MSRSFLSSALMLLGLASGLATMSPGVARADLIKLDMLLEACAGKNAVTRADCNAYVAGIADALASQHAICIPAGAELKNIRELVVGYLQARKPEREASAAAGVGDALRAGYSCASAAPPPAPQANAPIPQQGTAAWFQNFWQQSRQFHENAMRVLEQNGR